MFVQFVISIKLFLYKNIDELMYQNEKCALEFS